MILAWLLLASVALAAPAAVPPILPGLHGEHALSLRAQGELLIGELGCAACHEHPAGWWSRRPAPDLSEAGARIRQDYLSRFIARPHAVQPGTLMPDVLAQLAAEQRDEVAGAIADFLIARPWAATSVDSAESAEPPELVEPTAQPEPGAGGAAAGRTLFHTLGCVACHSPRDEEEREIRAAGVISLAHLGDKYRQPALAAFLFQPTRAHPAGRMPDMQLTRSEASAIAGYLLGAEGDAGSDPEPVSGAPASEERVARGRGYFEDYGCASCHPLPGLTAPPRPAALRAADLTMGCLADAPNAAPRFGLDASQSEAIRAALVAGRRSGVGGEPGGTGDPGGAGPSPTERLALTLAAFNCTACHERDGRGGVPEAIDGHFTSSEPALGNEARIPPPLTLAGARLTPEWLHRVLFDGAAARPYMTARMPRYRPADLGDLPELFATLDSVPAVPLPPLDRDERKPFREAGRQLIGDEGLGCVACHQWGGKPAAGLQGLDLLTTPERLRPSWFAHFLRDPAAFRPGITMPSYWPGGHATRTDILEGDSDAQIRAIWHYLALGQSARDPAGISTPGARLEVTDRARVYRGRSRVAGFRGIAVGFPGGLGYGFDAQNGSLAALWHGGFVNVNWRGQAAGDWNPDARPVELPRDVALLRLPAGDAPWPLRPQTTKEQPVNPDPTYPRNHGYRFGGYHVDADGVPTLTYRCGDVTVHDRSVPAPAEREGAPPRLDRRLRFSTPAPQTLWLRLLAGEIEGRADGSFHAGQVAVRVDAGDEAGGIGARAILRLSEAAGGAELRVELPLPEGETEITIRYELVR